MVWYREATYQGAAYSASLTMMVDLSLCLTKCVERQCTMFSYIKNETCNLYTPTAGGVSNQTANIVPQYQKDTTLYLPVCLNTGTKNVYAVLLNVKSIVNSAFYFAF